MKKFFKKVFSKESLAYAMDCLKFGMMLFFMTTGIWFVLSVLWVEASLPLETWSMLVTFVIACVCERLWMWWVSWS